MRMNSRVRSTSSSRIASAAVVSDIDDGARDTPDSSERPVTGRPISAAVPGIGAAGRRGLSNAVTSSSRSGSGSGPGPAIRLEWSAFAPYSTRSSSRVELAPPRASRSTTHTVIVPCDLGRGEQV